MEIISPEPLTSSTVAPLSLATALASSVLPVPGGPYSKRPGILSVASTPYLKASGRTSDRLVRVFRASMVVEGACTSAKVVRISSGFTTPFSNFFS